MKHRFLKKLITRAGLSEGAPPSDQAGWQRFLELVDRAFRDADQDRYLLERSLTLSSGEMMDRADALKSSEELWRSLVQNLPDLICTTDLQGNITFTNRPIAGETRTQVIGRPFLDFMEPSERDRVSATIDLMLNRSRSISIEARARLISTEPTWYNIRAAVIQSDVQPKGLILICTDIGVRKALQLETDRFRMLLDYARESIMVVDPDDFGRVVDVNKRVLEQLGYEHGELRAKRFVELIAEPDFCSDGSWAAHVERSKVRGGNHVIQGLMKHKDGRKFPVEMFTSFVKTGEQGYLLVMALDVTERRRLETQLDDERARVAFSSKMATLGEMAGGIAHEINNPVTIIDGYAQQLSVWVDQEPFDKLRVKVQAKKISDTVMRIARIVRGLRTFSRDGTHDPLQRTDVKTLVEDTLGLCTEKFRMSEIHLITPPAAHMALVIDCRPTEMSQVLLNLLFNAKDAVADLPEKWVKLEIVDVSNFIEFSVTDSGQGVPPDIRQRMMQPFFTTKDVGQGTGLGLSISRGIIEAHGGRLYYDEKSPNTRFVVVIPKHRSVIQSAS